MELKNYLNNRIHRTIEIRAPQETESGLVIEIAASSDVPYRRQFGYETLLHREGAVNYDRVMAGSCPVLYNHKNDEYIGIVERVWLVDGQLRAVIRLSKNSEFARQVSADIQDGILRSISIGYEINDMMQGEDIDGIAQYIATKWTLYEISVVTTPADYIKAGIGRSDEQPNPEEEDMKKKDFGTVMEMVNALTDEEKLTLLESVADDLEDTAEEAVEEVMEEMPLEEIKAEHEDMDEMPMEEEKMACKEGEYYDEEMKMCKEMGYESIDGEATQEEEKVIVGKKSAPKATSRSNKGETMSNKQNGSETGADNTVRLAELAAKYERTADLATWIKEGRTAEEVALDILETKSNASKVSGPAIHVKKSDSSLPGAVKAWLQGNNSELAERGIDQARATGRAITPGTLYIPTDVPMIQASALFGKRDGTAYGNTGANAVGKEFLTWEQTLREGALLARVGGQVLALNDVASMPYFSVPTTGSTFAETGSSTDKEVEVGIKNWQPKRVSARYIFSNLLTRLNGTYDFESELYNDLVAESVRIFDAQIWGGAGTAGVMTGLSRDTNIPALNLSGSFALASASAMIANVATNNADVANGVFVLDHQVYSTAFSTQAFGAGSGMSILNVIEGNNPVFRTGYLPEVQSGKKVAMFGDFSKVTAATFGPVEIKRDDLTKLQTGQTVLQLEMFADVAARNPNALVRWTNVTV